MIRLGLQYGLQSLLGQVAWLFLGVNVGYLNLKKSEDEAKEDSMNLGATSEMNLEDEVKEDGVHVGAVP